MKRLYSYSVIEVRIGLKFFTMIMAFGYTIIEKIMEDSILIDKNELDWLLKGFEIRRNIQTEKRKIMNCF
jgi:hypothetical protein